MPLFRVTVRSMNDFRLCLLWNLFPYRRLEVLIDQRLEKKVRRAKAGVKIVSLRTILRGSTVVHVLRWWVCINWCWKSKVLGVDEKQREGTRRATPVDFFHLQINSFLDYHFKVSSMSDFREDYSGCEESLADGVEDRSRCRVAHYREQCLESREFTGNYRTAGKWMLDVPCGCIAFAEIERDWRLR